MSKPANRARTGKRGGVTKTSFKPGQSGNPSGRPKLPPEIQGLARAYCNEAIVRLVALMKSDNESVAVRAAEALLDRGYGRPAQAMEVSGPDGGPIPHKIELAFVAAPCHA